MTTPEKRIEERSWTRFGHRTAAEVEGFEEWERQSLEVCSCTHLRREHFVDARGCVHVAHSRSSAGVSRMECGCTGFTAAGDSGGLSATQSDFRAVGDHRTAETGETR